MKGTPRKTRSDSVTGMLETAQRKTKAWPAPKPIRLNSAQTELFNQLTACREKWDQFSLALLATATQLIVDRQAVYYQGIESPLVILSNGVETSNPALKLAAEMQNQICQIFMRLGLKESALSSESIPNRDEGDGDIRSLLAGRRP